VCACTILAPTAVRRRVVAGASAPRPQAHAVVAPLDTPSICGEGLPSGLACVAVACGTTVGALTLVVGMAYAYTRRKRSASERICAADGPALPASALPCARHRHGHRTISDHAATGAPEPRELHPPRASPTGCAGGRAQAESPPPLEPTRTGTHAVPGPSSAPAEPRAQQRIVGASDRDRLPTREPARLRLPSNRVAPIGAHGQVGGADGLALPQSNARLAETQRELLLPSTAPTGVPAVTPLSSTVPARTSLPPIGSQVLPKRRRRKRAAGVEGLCKRSAEAHTPSPPVAEHGPHVAAAVEIGARVCSGECGVRVTDAETDGVAKGTTDGRVPAHGQRRASLDGAVCTDMALAVAEALSQRCRAPVCADPALSTLRRERPQSALAAAGGRAYTARALPPRPASAGASMRPSVQGRSRERGCEASVQPSDALPPAGQRRNRPSSAISVCVRL